MTVHDMPEVNITRANRAIRRLKDQLQTATHQRDTALSLLAGVQSMHRPARGENDRGSYTICDYDKTEWPCRTHSLLHEED